jgi:hypothetical protein
MDLASDYNALAFDPDSNHDPYAKHFISRSGARNKKLTVEFNPSKHRHDGILSIRFVLHPRAMYR